MAANENQIPLVTTTKYLQQHTQQICRKRKRENGNPEGRSEDKEGRKELEKKGKEMNEESGMEGWKWKPR